MSRKGIFIVWGTAAFFVGLFHVLALSLYLYWLVPWTDSAVHMIAGAVVFTPLYLLFREHMGIWYALALSLLALLGVDIAWEIFEYVQGLTQFEPAFWPDTVTDTVASFVGAFLAFAFLAGSEKSA